MRRFGRVFDALWLLALMGFVLAGLTVVTFHGDESMQIYMSHDYATAFIDRAPERLLVNPPYFIDEDPWLRILNGSINRYVVGLSWHIGGYTTSDLPPRPGWDWGLDYSRNVETGHRSPDNLLWGSRLPSALFLALSVPVMFGIGWLLGGRLPACVVSGVYALHPTILVNGRRAMMEGSLLLFGLLTVLVALVIVRQRWAERGPSQLRLPREVLLWLLLALVGGLALASKHTGILFVVGAWGWVWLAEVAHAWERRRFVSVAAVTGVLAVVAALTLGLFIALSPALWNDPPSRIRDLLEQRAGLLDIQVEFSPPYPIEQRFVDILLEPFLRAPQHFEVEHWGADSTVVAEIDRYMASPLSGLQFGPVLGLGLSLLSLLGLVAAAWPRLRPGGAWLVGVYAWVLPVVASLLINPLAWQRYFVPEIPLAVVLAGVGLLSLVRLLQPRLRPQSTLAGSREVVHTNQ